ncbi:MAG TPA: DUF5985 family protein [Steroidobacteraceae bacterium]|jgi:hypothetical protein|nr:DUF5985 family protein [Steroidobacteraceae bacterium]
MIAELIYIACALTSAGCAWLLLKGYRATGTRLLLWAGLCFIGQTLDNVVLFIDLVLTPASIDLFYWRTVLALVGMIALVYGLIWESR